jgi:predicted helicase
LKLRHWKKKYRDKTERLTENQKAQYNKKSKELKEIAKRQKQLENKGKARQNLLKFEETDERPYFLWHLYFMDVFEHGGFDIIIGNPPYIQIQKMEEAEKLDLEEAKYDTYTRTGDIYCLFYEKGFDLLNDDGVLTYITSNKWMRGGYGKAMRKFFSETNTLKILDLGPGIFSFSHGGHQYLRWQKQWI